MKQNNLPHVGVGVGVVVSHDGRLRDEPVDVGLVVAKSREDVSFLPGPSSSWPQDIVELLADPDVPKVGDSLKRDIVLLRRAGIDLQGSLFDTEIAHAVMGDSSSSASIGCSPMAARDRVLRSMREQDDLGCELKMRGLSRVFWDVEMPLIPVLAAMECEGITADKKALAEQKNDLAFQVEATREKANDLAGRHVNLDSLEDVGRLLFEELRICDRPRKTRTGQYATDADTLRSLEGKHPTIRTILDYREQSTLLRGYLDQLPDAIAPATGRIYTTYDSTTAATGRLTSRDPNLQNIPVRDGPGQAVRAAFLPRNEDHLLLSADYSQLELRILASLSHEEILLGAFLSGADVHTATAGQVFGLAADQVTAEMRSKAKMVNYGIAYGMSAAGLSQRLGISRASAADFIARFFAKFPGLQRYRSETLAFARENGFVQTVTGRRRYLPDINSRTIAARSAAERQAINAPIQGTAADMIKIAMIGIHRDLEARKLKTRMLLQVHDELVFDLYHPEQQEVTGLVDEKMRTAIALDVPLAVNFGTGRNWLEASLRSHS